MSSTKITIRRLACLVTAFAALATGVAAGSEAKATTTCTERRAQDCMTDAAFRALLIRSEALNREHGLGAAR
jgi:hypothetical protein